MADRLPSTDTSHVVDVEFETLGPAARHGRAPTASAPPKTSDASPPARLGVLGPAAPARRREPMPLPMFAAVATLSACAAFYLSGGYVLFMNDAPRQGVTQDLDTVPSNPLALADISVRVDTGSGRAIYVIRAMIENRSGSEATVPPVTVTFGDPGGASVVHTVPRGERLRPGERMGFTTRIPAGDTLTAEPRLGFRTDV